MREIQSSKKKLYRRFLKNCRLYNKLNNLKARGKKKTENLIFPEIFQIQKKNFLFAKNF